MAVSDWSTTAALNTTVGGINITGAGSIAQGDDAIRAMMADIKAGVPYLSGTTYILAPSATSAVGIAFPEDSDNGAHKVTLKAADTLAADYVVTLPSATGTIALTSDIIATTAASTTEVLTGTDTAKYATPNAVAALWEKGPDVASVGTVSLGEGGLFHITGTTTITDIDFATAKDGRRATLIFDGILTLTHNATTLKLPGGANITTAANDRCVVIQDSSDNVYVESYTKADGTAVVVPAGGQPIPTTSALPIGFAGLMERMGSGGTITDGGTISGTILAIYGTVTGGSQTGTWKNISGASSTQTSGNFGLWVRTA